jgi:2-polyprenyl-6-methoxyphenol hydroxylase-like FAD-dependent oxidoreductase
MKLRPEAARILVVGAGPVGLTAAVELARRGYRPRIVDAGEGPVPVSESRALAVNLRTLDLLERCGAAARITEEAQVVQEMRLWAGRRRLATVRLGGRAGRPRGLHALPQGRIERILLDRLLDLGIAPEWRVRCTAVDDPSKPLVELTHGDGGVEQDAFDLVVGADGAHSTVRRAVGLDFPGEALTQTFYLADYVYPVPVETGFAEARFYDPGVVARLPVGARTLRFVSTLADYAERIAHPVAPESVEWQSTFKVSFRHVDEMSRGRVFLAGDAAHIHSPIGGRGMNLGIEDACWLAWLISEGREGEYTALRMPAVRKVVADTRRTTRMVVLENPLLCGLRNLAVPILARIGPLTRPAVAGVLGLDTPPPPWLNDAQSDLRKN